MLNDFVADVFNYLPNTPTGKLMTTAALALVMGIAAFMVLNQLRIAPDIVTITYAASSGQIRKRIA